MVLNWIKKKLGYHVCEEWTQWEQFQGTFRRPTSYEVDGSLWINVKELEYTRRWQERKCTICGRQQVESLEQH